MSVPAAGPCASCSTPTTALHRLCPECLRARVARECETQGVPFDLPPVLLARVDVLSRPSLAARRALGVA